MTEPFADFSASAIVRLGITRTYSSADSSLRGGPIGPFGRGWHHEWEASLSCVGGVCTVARGLHPGFQFHLAETVTSLDGTEQWQLYRAFKNQILSDGHRNLLARRPGGEWILFLTDGSELRFAPVCDACDLPESTCGDPLNGGVARVTSTVDPAGRMVRISYSRTTGVIVSLADDLGHVLEVRSADACGSGLASELRYDGMIVARYEYAGSDLVRASDADGSTLRGYAYDPGGSGLLRAVLNEGGAAIAEFSYDASGNAIGLVDAESSVAVAYGAKGRVDVTESFGSTSSTSQRSFGSHGNILAVSDGCACGPPRQYTWRGRSLVCETDASGAATYREYDQLGRVIRYTEYSGDCPPPATGPSSAARVRSYDYGVTKPIARGLALDLETVRSVSRRSTVNSATPTYVVESSDYDPGAQSIDPEGYSCQSSPLPAGSVVCRRISSGYVPTDAGSAFERHATFVSYDSRGRLVRSIGPVNLDRPSPSDVTPVEERTYWPDDESLARRGRLRELKHFPSPGSAPLVTSFDHDAFGVYQVRAPDGQLTTFVHDGRGRIRWTMRPGGSVEEVRYYDGSLPRVRISPAGAVTRTSYDGKGRPSLVERLSSDPDVAGTPATLAWAEAIQYDSAGNPVHVERRDRLGEIRWKQDREFDVHHREVRASHPEVAGVARTSAYDSQGFLTAITDEEGRSTGFTPDALRRVGRVTRAGLDSAGAPVSLVIADYTYQEHSDALATVVDGRGRATAYRYDDFGRVYSISSNTLKDGAVRFKYDARGNLLERKDQHVTVTSTYDGLDRVLTVAAANTADSSTIAYAYRYDENAARGRLTSVVEPERTVLLGYDAQGRVVAEDVYESGLNASPLRTTFVLDRDGALAELIYPSALQVEFGRDPATREIVQVRNVADGTSYASAATHHPGGPLSSVVFGNGLALDQFFNLRYEPQALSSGPISLGYAMTPAGKVGSMTQGGALGRFAYDFQDRLTGAPGGLGFGYDDAGNRTWDRIEGGPAAVHSYQGDRLTGIDRGFQYRGCYTDSSARALPVQLMSGGANAQTCAAAARQQGLRYAGLQYYGYCFGGNTLGFTKVSDAECSTRCSADPSEFCGGSYRNTLYEVFPSTTPLVIAYDNQANISAIRPPDPTPPPPAYVGCYTDSSTRALPVQLMSSGATAQTCAAAARKQGLKYAGLQYYSYCFGGNALGYSKVADSECSARCTANQSEFCGGAYRNSVYLVDVAPPPTAACLRHDPFGRLAVVGKTPASTVSADGIACTTDSALTEVTARFKYDWRGRRIARWLASTNDWTYIVSDAEGNPLSELVRTSDPSNPWRKVRDYVWLDGRPLAQIEYPGAGEGTGGYVYYFHLDHIGLPRALTNQAGQTVWSGSASPYGGVVETTTPDPLSGRTVVTNLRLPGQYDERLFAAAGLSGMQGPYYNWNRWYLPTVGRYLELDPLAMRGEINGFGAPDWYNYALANPLTYTDPSGENPLVGAGAGTLVCGPPCTAIGFLAGLGAAAVIGKIGSDVIDICRSPKRPKKGYECTAKCQANGASGGAYYVTGTSSQNCGQATLNAKAAVPLGQYPRHCSCSDTDGFRGVGHQCEAHTR